MASLSQTFVLRGERDTAALYAFLKRNWPAMAEAKKPLAVTVSEHKERRSLSQNKRYFALLTAISEQVWVGGRKYDPEVWHEELKNQFAPKEESPSGGMIAMSTARMDVEQFSAYMLQVELHAMNEFSVEFSL
jgi:hypothetical protein